MKSSYLTIFLIIISFFSVDLFSQEETKHQVSFVKNESGFWRVDVNGKVIQIQGAGGVISPGMLEEFAQVGGNFTRTWGIGTLEQKVTDGVRYIDKAHELGVNVMAGLWIGHERHGFNYANQEHLDKQRAQVIADVRKWKSHPGIAVWGLGNEMEGPQSKKGNPAVWKELEYLAKLIKKEDPNRPVMTVIAGTATGKIKSLIKYCPSIDAVGINSYGAAAGAGETLTKLGWVKPFAITEVGVKGFWEVPKTSWGAPIEPNSSEKAKSYYSTQKLVAQLNTGKKLCLGTFAFVWGSKQEKTSTWFGMYLNTKEKLPQVDALVKAWTGKWPDNRAPKIKSVKASFFGKKVSKNTELSASVDVVDPEGDQLHYEWIICDESKAQSVGGDHEYAPRSYPELTVINSTSTCSVVAPSKAGQYRLFLTIRDGKGSAATANIPFLVN